MISLPGAGVNDGLSQIRWTKGTKFNVPWKPMDWTAMELEKIPQVSATSCKLVPLG